MNENLTNNRMDRHTARQQRREARQALGSGNEWIGGVILILIGVLLLGQNLRFVPFANWWALFILLPAFGSFGTAWGMYRSAGRFTVRVRSAIIVGMGFTLVTIMFLLNLSWTYLGPALLVLAGISLFINALLPD